MATWSPVPFVIGPLNGGLRWPPQFREELAREREWLSYLRRAYRVLPYLRSTYRDASAVLAAFKHTIDDLPQSASAKVIDFPEVGIDPDIFREASKRKARKQKVILFVGRLVPYKLPQVVVRAFAERPALRSHRLVIVGDGPERAAIEEIIRDHGLDGQVELHGWKTQPEVGELMREADIFAFPSIRELGAGVVVEAMACGLACVAVDYGAPATLIGSDRGIKVPLGGRDEITCDFGLALERLVSEPETAARLGAAARDHAMRFYTWDAKARKTLAVYEWVLSRGPRPDFWSVDESAPS
jgi:glycosyltransferase involved in cell wall biosynthesis